VRDLAVKGSTVNGSRELTLELITPHFGGGLVGSLNIVRCPREIDESGDVGSFRAGGTRLFRGRSCLFQRFGESQFRCKTKNDSDLELLLQKEGQEHAEVGTSIISSGTTHRMLSRAMTSGIARSEKENTRINPTGSIYLQASPKRESHDSTSSAHIELEL
jgi:hypothetical protein